MTPDESWPYGSRQVRFRAMFQMYFNHFSRLDAPRRVRRLMARKKARRVYRETAAEMMKDYGHLTLEKKSFWQRMGDMLKAAAGRER